MKKIVCRLMLFSAIVSSPVMAVDSFYDAVKNGETKLDLRLRYENKDQSSPTNKTANALTLRTRLNYKTDSYKGFSGFLEVDDVTALDDDAYNSTTNGLTRRATIADPEGTEVNQVWFNFHYADNDAKWGRQRILLDNQRFVGGVGFRQNEQTYDALSITNKSLANTKIFIANVNNVNRIFGEDSSVGDHNSNTHLVNIKFSGLAAGDIITYAYLIDNKDFSRFSTDTYGVRFQGKTDDWKYTLEYATQDNADHNSLDYYTDYILAELGYTVSGFNVQLSYESLGSDDSKASFITPLATLHKFQGWADQFLVTPVQGIQDLYLTASTKLAGVKFLLVYHEFRSDVDNGMGDDDLGSEVGFLVAKAFKPLKVSLKAASYSAGDRSFGKSDTDVVWLTGSASF